MLEDSQGMGHHLARWQQALDKEAMPCIPIIATCRLRTGEHWSFRVHEADESSWQTLLQAWTSCRLCNYTCWGKDILYDDLLKLTWRRQPKTTGLSLRTGIACSLGSWDRSVLWWYNNSSDLSRGILWKESRIQQSWWSWSRRCACMAATMHTSLILSSQFSMNHY